VGSETESNNNNNGGHINLKSGSAEIFGRQLRPKEPYILPPGSYAIFSWYGCTVEIDETRCDKIHYVSETPMDLYAGIHGNLELLRDNGHQQQKSVGPRVAVVGPSRSGKSTVANILAAYAVRCERTPIFVDLDVSNNSLSLPGAIAATKLMGPKGVNVSYGIMSSGPLTYYTGSATPYEDTEIFFGAVERLAKNLDERTERESGDNSGIIIDTFALTDTDNPAQYQALLSCLKMLKVGVVLVLGQVRLSQELRNDLGNGGTQVIKIPSPGDVIKRPERDEINKQAVRRYFEGTSLMPLQPSRKVVNDLAKFRVYRIHDKPRIDSAILPIGQASVIEAKNYTAVEIDSTLEKKVLGVSYANTESELVDPTQMKNIAGFVYVEKVDRDDAGNVQIDILSPSSADIPGTIYILGDLEIHEL